MKKLKYILLASMAILYKLVFAPVAQAICPVCTVAVVAGLGLSRYLGIDDTVSGVWIGGLILSTSLWLLDWLEKKKFQRLAWYYNFKYRSYAVVGLMYALVLIPLVRGEIIGHPFNRLWGIDKLILGIAFGTGAFLLGLWADKKVREVRGKQLFNFQKVVFPVTALLITSLVFFLITSVTLKIQ